VAAPGDALQATGVEQFVHRAQHVLDIDDQHHRAIVEQGPGGNVLHLAQRHPAATPPGYARRQTLHGHAVHRIALADHHHLQGFVILCAAGR
jgi:hypothetical protein